MIKLSKKEFEVLKILAISGDIFTQRELQSKTGFSLGTINKIFKDFTARKFIMNGKITKKGFEAIEPYSAKRAIFLAAGFGSRLVPITLNTPKPLIRVNGIRIIDRLIDACLKVGINEIYIIRGYLAEQFDQLLYKYPMIKFLENPVFNEANNISSILTARFLLENAYVLESDFLLYNESIIEKYHYTSDYLAFYKERTDDWCFKVEDEIIKEEKIGGIDCYQMAGISYWNYDDGKKLSSHIFEAYNRPGGKEMYWEQVPIIMFNKDYKVYIKKCNENDLREIDTFSDLKSIDRTYNI